MTRTLLAVLIAAPLAAHAAPPPGSDPDSPRAEWFRSLMPPHGSIPCCRESDCRNTEVRETPDGNVQAWIGRREYGQDAPDAWLDVPASAMVEREDNPTGHVVVCFWQGRVLCLVPMVGG